MIEDPNKQDMLNQLILENQKLLTENNQLLKKLHRRAIWSFWIKIISMLVVIGLPFVLYYYLIEPYFTALGSSFEVFKTGLEEVPGWKQFYNAFTGVK